MSSNRRK